MTVLSIQTCGTIRASTATSSTSSCEFMGGPLRPTRKASDARWPRYLVDGQVGSVRGQVVARGDDRIAQLRAVEHGRRIAGIAGHRRNDGPFAVEWSLAERAEVAARRRLFDGVTAELGIGDRYDDQIIQNVVDLVSRNSDR